MNAIDTLQQTAREHTSGNDLVGYHSNEHCCCGNWFGAGSLCLYTPGEAMAMDVEEGMTWYPRSEVKNPWTIPGVNNCMPPHPVFDAPEQTHRHPKRTRTEQ